MISITSNATAPSSVPTVWWNGQEYHQNSVQQCNLALEVLQKHSFKGDEKVLDIGCGNGAITNYIASEKVPHGSVVGLDASRSMIDSSMANFARPNLAYQEGLAESFQIDGVFDVIVSFSTLHWVPHQQAVWNNIRRHLKIGGHALVSLNPAPRSKELIEAIDYVIQRSEYSLFFLNFTEKSHMPCMNIEEYEKLILQTGLKVEECKQSIKYFEYENKTVFANNLKAWLPHAAQVSKEMQDAFMQSIVATFLDRTHQKDNGQVRLDFNNFFVKATRIN